MLLGCVLVSVVRFCWICWWSLVVIGLVVGCLVGNCWVFDCVGCDGLFWCLLYCLGLDCVMFWFCVICCLLLWFVYVGVVVWFVNVWFVLVVDWWIFVRLVLGIVLGYCWWEFCVCVVLVVVSRFLVVVVGDFSVVLGYLVGLLGVYLFLLVVVLVVLLFVVLVVGVGGVFMVCIC